MPGIACRRVAIAFSSALVIAGCSASHPRPDASPSATSRGPALQGHVLVLSPADHAVAQANPTGPLTVITKNATAAELSPDRKTLAYITQAAELVLRDLTSGAERTVDVTSGKTPRDPAPDCLHWSPDGRRLSLRALSDKGLYVTTRAGVATPIDLPKHEKYAQNSGHPIFGAPDPDAPSYDVASQVTCGRWLDDRRLVFDRVVTMPASITVDADRAPEDAPADTTTLALLSPPKLIDTDQRWEVWERCGTHAIISVDKQDRSSRYVLDTTATGDDALTHPESAGPPTAQLPDTSAAFIRGSCDVLLIGTCPGIDEPCPTKRYSPATGTTRDLPPTRQRNNDHPDLYPGTVAWNPAGTQYAADHDGYVSIYDLETGTSSLIISAAEPMQVLGWLSN